MAMTINLLNGQKVQWISCTDDHYNAIYEYSHEYVWMGVPGSLWPGGLESGPREPKTRLLGQTISVLDPLGALMHSVQ